MKNFTGPPGRGTPLLWNDTMIGAEVMSFIAFSSASIAAVMEVAVPPNTSFSVTCASARPTQYHRPRADRPVRPVRRLTQSVLFPGNAGETIAPAAGKP